MKRVFLIVLDSVGVGSLPDAAAYGDEGSNTLGHIIDQQKPHLPNLAHMGLGRLEGITYDVPQDACGLYGRAGEKSAGKDTTTGHWELMGLTLHQAFPTYPDGFPSEIITAFEDAIGTKTLGNYASSGTVILDELGEEHMRTGFPIVYTSADSVFQIACHEELYPPKKLYELCETARNLLCGEHAVARVIARPFIGTGKGAFTRTLNRRDFSLYPTKDTLLNTLSDHGIHTIAIGKIEDIFCMSGIAQSDHAAGNPACMESLFKTLKQDFSGFVFVNLVDFDSLYGHRRDVRGYAEALEAFDLQLAELKQAMNPDDLLIITADHGCDPTYKGTDHTREYIPILAWHQGMTGLTDIGTRSSFVDVAATISELFGQDERFGGASFATDL